MDQLAHHPLPDAPAATAPRLTETQLVIARRAGRAVRMADHGITARHSLDDVDVLGHTPAWTYVGHAPAPMHRRARPEPIGWWAWLNALLNAPVDPAAGRTEAHA